MPHTSYHILLQLWHQPPPKHPTKQNFINVYITTILLNNFDLLTSVPLLLPEPHRGLSQSLSVATSYSNSTSKSVSFEQIDLVSVSLVSLATSVNKLLRDLEYYLRVQEPTSLLVLYAIYAFCVFLRGARTLTFQLKVPSISWSFCFYYWFITASFSTLHTHLQSDAAC